MVLTENLERHSRISPLGRHPIIIRAVALKLRKHRREVLPRHPAPKRAKRVEL
jgi:hypothetical protein